MKGFDLYHYFTKKVKPVTSYSHACQRYRRSGSLKKALTRNNAFSFSAERVYAAVLGEMTSFEEACRVLVIIQPSFDLIHFNTPMMLLQLWHHCL